MAFTDADDEPLWDLTLIEPAAPADHVDRALTELLDIQDDIATAVMWLAEHWTVDLPEITWCPGNPSEGYALRLMACTQEVAALVRLADLLDAPVVEAEPHGGSRWLHARRHFGWVLLDVFHGFDEADPVPGYLAKFLAKCNEPAGAA